MFMTRIALNSRRRGAIKLLSNRHAMHAAVMSSFSHEAPTESDSGRVLWRVDQDGHSVDLLIVSPTKPCLTHVVEQAGWTTENAWVTRDYTPFLDSITDGDNYVFRLSANPTYRFTDEKGHKSIVGHKTVEHQRRWLVEKSDQHGFAIAPSSSALDRDGVTPALQLELGDRDRTRFRREEGRVTLVTVSYEGLLTVTDVESFRRMLGHGLGRAKGYGCGLMTVLPASRT
jgi:CRISPR system Cascade subunit CasE